jgi:hypothetical protein
MMAVWWRYRGGLCPSLVAHALAVLQKRNVSGQQLSLRFFSLGPLLVSAKEKRIGMIAAQAIKKSPTAEQYKRSIVRFHHSSSRRVLGRRQSLGVHDDPPYRKDLEDVLWWCQAFLALLQLQTRTSFIMIITMTIVAAGVPQARRNVLQQRQKVTKKCKKPPTFGKIIWDARCLSMEQQQHDLMNFSV